MADVHCVSLTEMNHNEKAVSQVLVRVYGSLNDFLPAGHRAAPSCVRFAGRTTVKDLIEGLGVPHPEIDLILANNQPVGFDALAHDGDRIAVYPLFQTLDVRTVSLVRAAPPDATRFVLDGHLAKLARYLRLMGLDALCPPEADDAEIARVALREARIVLTRDHALLKRGTIAHGYFVRETRSSRQLVEVLRRYPTASPVPFTRCLRCNAALAPVPRHAIEERLQPRTRTHYEEFWECTGCNQLFWKGAHWTRLLSLVETTLAELGNRVSGK
jgi:uncharacterized protein